jgi:hypothetical protein
MGSASISVSDQRKGSSGPRLDSRLEAEGAEFLVLGHLLLHRIAAYKTYTNLPNYDLIAVEPALNRSARIQVKSRWRTGAPGFLIKTVDCDFVVAACLNRGRKGGGGDVLPPIYYVFPAATVRRAHRAGEWGKVYFKDIDEHEHYRDAWHLVAEFLAQDAAPAKRRRSKPTG